MNWFEVMQRFENGDALAFDQLSALIREKLSRMRGRTQLEQADDVVQETLVSLLKAWRRGCIREERCFEGFVWRLAERRLADVWNRSSRPGAPDCVGDPELAVGTETLPEIGERRDQALDLARAFEGLGGVDQRAVWAIYLNGQTYSEAATSLGLPLGTFKRKLGDGLRRLRSRLQ